MAGKWIDISAADGGKFRGYLTVPAGGKGPGIVLCQEIFGINAYVREVADYYAEEGYVVLAPDLFWRHGARTSIWATREADWQKAFDFFQTLRRRARGWTTSPPRCKALRARPEVAGKVGALGFCLGGKLAYLAAARSGVDVRGGLLRRRHRAVLERSRPSVRPCCTSPSKDKYVPPEAVEKIKAAFKGRSDVEIYVYPGQDHAFARTGGDHYDQPSALMAHLAFDRAVPRVHGPALRSVRAVGHAHACTSSARATSTPP